MKTRKNKIIDIILLVVIIICLFNIGNSLYHIFEWKKDGDDIKEQVEDIYNITKPTEVIENHSESGDENETISSNIEIIEENVKPDEYNPYWAYINMNLINVDFYDLKEVNKDTVGWIQVNGTNVNYPFVQTKDNSYYLTHAFNKKENSAGWVFLDYRNNSKLTDKNNIIYAHGRYDSTMFGSLRKSLTNGWLNNTDNYIIKISTPYENTMWQVFSIYRIQPTSDYLKINFNSDDDFSQFASVLINRSEHNFNTNVSLTDRIITLSTCYDESKRIVIHAKLIKKETKIDN